MRKERQRPFIERISSDTREYVQSLLEVNDRLTCRNAELELELEHTQQSLERALASLGKRQQVESALAERMESIEREKRSYAQRYLEVEQRNNDLANLYVASYQLHGTLNREAVLAAIVEIVINLVGSEELAVWELDDASRELRLIASFGIDADAWNRVRLGNGVIGACAATGQPFVAGSETLSLGPERTLTACIPLRLDETVVGAIAIFRLLQQKQQLEPIDHELFELLASHAASALYCTRASLPVLELS